MNDVLSYLVPCVAIVGGFGYLILSRYWRSKPAAQDPALQRAFADSAAVNREVLDRLARIEGRLGSVEKTLTDIPS